MAENSLLAYYVVNLPGFDGGDFHTAWRWLHEHEIDFAMDVDSYVQTDDGWQIRFSTDPDTELIPVLQKHLRKDLMDKKITVRFESTVDVAELAKRLLSDAGKDGD